MKDITNKRCNELYSLGLTFNFNENSFIGKEEDILDFNVHTTEITCSTEEEWNKIINTFKEEIIKRRNK